MQPSIRLFSFPISHNAVRTEVTLREKGLEFEKISLDLTKGEHKKPPLSDITPRGQVPTLVWNDGSGDVVVYESIATIQFLNDVHPEPPLLPPITAPRQRAVALMRMAEFQAKFDHLNILGSVLFRGQGRAELGDRIDKLVAEIVRWEAYIAGQDYLAGDQFTLADIAVFPLLTHFEALGYDYAGHTPELAAYIARCKARPSFRDSGWLETFSSFVTARAPAKVLAD